MHVSVFQTARPMLNTLHVVSELFQSEMYGGPKGTLSSRVHEFTSSRVHEFTSSRVHEFTSSRVHEFTSSRVHEFISSRVHEDWARTNELVNS